ncbi:MAG: helix-turn-helix domain-containing protein [Candidatus Thiodiazotropha weberae]|nr:helix-turn-helix domain-containing protein [Candidatus Thiodiazotropha weberae]
MKKQTDRDKQPWRKRVARILRQRGMTQKDLADAIGCSLAQVEKLMQGRARYYHDFAESAAQVLQVSLAWVLDGLEPGDVSCPLLNASTVEAFLSDDLDVNDEGRVPRLIQCSSWLHPGSRTFCWEQALDDLDDGAGGWREGDVLYIDPDAALTVDMGPVVLAKLDRGFIVRRWRTIAGDDWLVPGNRVYNSIPVEETGASILGLVLGGLRRSPYLDNAV